MRPRCCSHIWNLSQGVFPVLGSFLCSVLRFCWTGWRKKSYSSCVCSTFSSFKMLCERAKTFGPSMLSIALYQSWNGQSDVLHVSPPDCSQLHVCHICSWHRISTCLKPEQETPTRNRVFHTLYHLDVYFLVQLREHWWTCLVFKRVHSAVCAGTVTNPLG